MRIGIMLRHMSQHGGGVSLYTRSLLREMLSLDTPHEFVLIYRDPCFVGTFPDGDRVREIAVEAPSIFLWDQLAVRRVEKKEGLDVIFNPKYSLPLMARCKTVFVCHGLDWYVMPWGSRWIDRLSHRVLIPRYADKADAIIAVSNSTREHVIKYLGVDEDRVHTIYLGVNESFREPIPRGKREEIKQSYRLPDRFFLYCGQIYPPKNFGRLLQAYAQVGPQRGVSLVVAGEHRWLCDEEIELVDKLNISDWVHWSGWVEHNILPTFYSLAEALLLPSLYEACPSPIFEAMATGCPIVTSNRYGTRELVGEAGILVDPEDVDSIAEGMRRVLADDNLRQQLVKVGYKRVQDFNWEKCARQTLNVLESV